ncbi:MAG: transposase, partial [Burkholderiaceae bacterium]|nr:transposase [Burkholderiaceae bacterium]
RRRRRFFTDDFKREIASAYLKEKVSINQIAQNNTVTRRSVTQWVEKFKDELMKDAQ